MYFVCFLHLSIFMSSSGRGGPESLLSAGAVPKQALCGLRVGAPGGVKANFEDANPNN